jgi:uncharacterized DUF497 family protein
MPRARRGPRAWSMASAPSAVRPSGLGLCVGSSRAFAFWAANERPRAGERGGVNHRASPTAPKPPGTRSSETLSSGTADVPSARRVGKDVPRRDAFDDICSQMHTHGVPTVVEGDYEWNEQKAAQNQLKHGVSFPEAVLALEDRTPSRRQTTPTRIGRSPFGLTPRGVLVVVSTERRDRTRIIRARRATHHEERGYQANRK